ncbi:hypothetical protein BJP35_2268 [Enterobacter sp. J49]|uniref:fimbrial protein n=1 Tax=Enterobacter sp. J49 TaxID=1903627 RepID=UPI000B67544F|nr:fimbrial protein [Enterobacter sp. J49]OUC37003.1 hypothetical protein BJP35_2268 [Enterobacter sp. J49]
MSAAKITYASILMAIMALPDALYANGHNWGRGQVSMQGSIIDAACAISTESRDQTLAIGTHSTGSLRRGQEISSRLTIELINCVQKHPDPGHPDNKQFQVTFDGEADGEHFRISGNARGLAIEISDENGHIARPGKALPPANIFPGKMTLNYNVKLVKNTKRIIPGNYHSAIRFKMDYF